MIYASSIEDLRLVVKKLAKQQTKFAVQEATMNTNSSSNLCSDIVPQFFGMFSDEEENCYLIFEYAGKSLEFAELSLFER